MRKIHKGIKKYVVLKDLEAFQWKLDSTTGNVVIGTDGKPELVKDTSGNPIYRTYYIVLKNRDTESKIVVQSTSTSWMHDDTNDIWYTKFIFTHTGTNGTDKLDEGYVDLYVYDSDNELIYTKMNYGKVFSTPK